MLSFSSDGRRDTKRFHVADIDLVGARRSYLNKLPVGDAPNRSTVLARLSLFTFHRSSISIESARNAHEAFSF